MSAHQEAEYQSLTPKERLALLLRGRLRDVERARAAADDMDALRAQHGTPEKDYDSAQQIRDWRDKR